MNGQKFNSLEWVVIRVEHFFSFCAFIHSLHFKRLIVLEQTCQFYLYFETLNKNKINYSSFY